MANELITYSTEHGEVKLSPQIIRNYLVPDAKVSDAEVEMFLQLCQYQKLNPFLREVYLVKYGDSPASMVTGKEVFTKRAMADPDFNGFEAGVTIIDASNQYIRREGSLALTEERLVGGWARVYLKSRAIPFFEEVSFIEYAAYNSYGKLTKMWSTKPGTMIRKVALVHALREAFPDKFEGLYSQEEINAFDPSQLPDKPVDIPVNETAKAKPVKAPDPVQQAQAPMKDITPPEQSLQQPPTVEPPRPVTAPAPVRQPEPEPPVYDTYTPAEFKIDFGKYTGKTLAEINKVDRSYLEWLSQKGKEAATRDTVMEFLRTTMSPTVAKPKTAVAKP